MSIAIAAPSQVERRTVPGGEVRVVPSRIGRITGYAALFDSRSQDLGGFIEIIRPGAFQKVLRSDVRALFNHDRNFILGRTTSGTLQLEEDERGLLYTIDLPDTAAAEQVHTAVKRGDVSGSSFAFSVEPEGQRWSETGGTQLRELLEIDRLFDVGPVTFPAYTETNVVSTRALEVARRRRVPALDHYRRRLQHSAQRFRL